MDFLTEEDLELLEPAPDIHALFVHYNELYFESRLGACSVEWSSARMTVCGGTCELIGGGAGGARIKLSEPLLKLRPTRDLKDVLLHEMTHAYMMLQGAHAYEVAASIRHEQRSSSEHQLPEPAWPVGCPAQFAIKVNITWYCFAGIRDDDRGGHGTIFKSIIQRINASQLPDHQRPPGGYNVAVYHTMHAEVDHYRQHHWQCERCGNLVKRAMNRPPQEADCRGRMGRGADCRDPDCRFHMHQKHCGGAWIKIKEPEGYQQKGKKRGGSSTSNASNASSGGAAGGSNGSHPDGAPLPAKRPKKGGGGLPASAAAGTRPITDFFGGGRSSGKQGTGPAEEAAAAAAAAAGEAGRGGSEVLPALQAVWGTAPAVPPVAEAQFTQHAQQPHQQAQQPQQPQRAERPEPSAEERRRLQAEAAMRRLVGAAGRGGQATPSMQQQPETCQEQRRQQQPEPGGQGRQQPQQQQPQQQPPPPPPPPQQQQAPQQQQQQQQQQQLAERRQDASQEAGEVIDLLDSPPGTAPSKQRWAGAAQQRQAEEQLQVGSEQLGHNGNGRAAADGLGSSAGAGSYLECPVCGRLWEDTAISNAELNAHIDECLNASFL